MLSKKQYLTLFLFTFYFSGCTSLFFQGDHKNYTNLNTLNMPYKEHIFISKQQNLHALYLNPHASKSIFVAHGNAQNLSAHIKGFLWLAKKGYGIFMFDYAGYGKSQGESNLQDAIQNTNDALRYFYKLNQEKPFVVVGQSLGGTMLLNALTQNEHLPIEFAVIDSTFTGFEDIATEKLDSFFLTWPFQWIANLSIDADSFDAYNNLNLSYPLLFLHGERDIIIPTYHSYKLFRKFKGKKEFWSASVGHIAMLQVPSVQKAFLELLQNKKFEFNEEVATIKIFPLPKKLLAPQGAKK